MNDAIKMAYKLAGSEYKLGRIAGVRQQSVNKWLNGTRNISLRHALNIQNYFNNPVITVETLMPKYQWGNDSKICIGNNERNK